MQTQCALPYLQHRGKKKKQIAKHFLFLWFNFCDTSQSTKSLKPTYPQMYIHRHYSQIQPPKCNFALLFYIFVVLIQYLSFLCFLLFSSVMQCSAVRDPLRLYRRLCCLHKQSVRIAFRYVLCAVHTYVYST